MSDATATPEAPAIVIDPTTSKPAAPAPAPVSKAEADAKPEWLDARLERERKSVLKDLGIDNIESAKKAIATAKAAEDAQKSADQRAAEHAARADRAETALRAKDEALGVFAKDQMATLTDGQRAAVTAVAGDDAALQIKTISALKPTWAGVAAPAAPAQSAPTAASTDTAPAASAPKGGAVTSPPDHKAVYAEMKKTNPVFAARYALEHGVFNT